MKQESECTNLQFVLISLNSFHSIKFDYIILNTFSFTNEAPRSGEIATSAVKWVTHYVEDINVVKILFFLFSYNPILCGILPMLPWILDTNKRMHFSKHSCTEKTIVLLLMNVCCGCSSFISDSVRFSVGKSITLSYFMVFLSHSS
jgi:hypothetical protein